MLWRFQTAGEPGFGSLKNAAQGSAIATGKAGSILDKLHG
jgi:hypothetical protein